MKQTKNWKNIAPKLCRQRIILEAVTDHLITPKEFKDYLVKLSIVVKMRPLGKPFAYPAEDMGYGGWIHWVTSGAHIYSYPKEVTGINASILTVDAYTCKPFSAKKMIDFTAKYFKLDKDKISWLEL
jgi:hypothetical protein